MRKMSLVDGFAFIARIIPVLIVVGLVAAMLFMVPVWLLGEPG